MIDDFNKIVICAAEIDDIDSIAKMESECFTDAWSWDSFHSCFVSPYYEIVVARIGEAIVGYGVVKSMYEDATDSRRWHFASFTAVFPPFYRFCP